MAINATRTALFHPCRYPKERQIWLEPRVLDRLKALRGPGESYSDLILRLAEA